MLIQDDIVVDQIPLLGNFADDRFSHAVRVTHLPTSTVVYLSPFDFPEPKLKDELTERALKQLEINVEKKKR